MLQPRPSGAERWSHDQSGRAIDCSGLSPLTSAGLASAGIGPNWPAELAGFPFWTQHNVDQVWTGSGWHVQSSKVLAVQGQARGRGPGPRST